MAEERAKVYGIDQYKRKTAIVNSKLQCKDTYMYMSSKDSFDGNWAVLARDVSLYIEMHLWFPFTQVQNGNKVLIGVHVSYNKPPESHSMFKVHVH